MYEIVFNSKLNEDGTIFCPKEYSFKEADYRVIVILPAIDDYDSDIEESSILDNSEEFLSSDELAYYMALD